MITPPWMDDRQMFCEVSPWLDWEFACEIAPVLALFVATAHGGKRHKVRGRYPEDIPNCDYRIIKHIGGYPSGKGSMRDPRMVRYHRIFGWTSDLSKGLLTDGRTKVKSEVVTEPPGASVLISTVTWFYSHRDRYPEAADLRRVAMPPMKVVRDVCGSLEDLHRLTELVTSVHDEDPIFLP